MSAVILTGFFVGVEEDDRPLTVRDRKSLSERPDTAVEIGPAPDGLPLVLDVGRRSSVASAVLSALRCARWEDLPGDIAKTLTALETAVQANARAQGLAKIGGRPVFRTASTVGMLLGDTILARVLGAESPLVLPEDRTGGEDRVPITSMVAVAEKPAEIMKEVGRKQYLAVPLTDGAPLVAGEKIDEDSPRTVRFEDLRTLKSARFHFRDDRDCEGEGALADAKPYARAIREARRVAWSVSREDAGRAILQIARKLQVFHKTGMVHGDVKPGNALLLAEGAVPHDAILTGSGKVSPAATPGWAAPEQILARPVSPATDVFALGLMVVSLLRGAAYGEERCYVVPVGGSARRRMRILGDAEVFLDPTVLEMPEPARRAWQKFLARCLAFDLTARPIDGGAFADAFEDLLASHPLPGRLGLVGGPGRLTRNVEIDGRVQPSWVISDRR